MARLKAMASNTSNLKYGSKAAVRYASFISAMTSARAPEKFDLRTATLEALAEKSATLLRTDAQTYGFELQESAGTLVVHDTASTTYTMPTLQAITAIEPSLYDARNVEGVTIERTTTWSSSFYAKQLREYLVSRNVRILCNHRVTGLISQNGQVKGIDCTTPLEADAVVVTAGLSSPDILPNECYGNVPLAPLTRAVYNVDLIADHRRVRHAVQSDDGRMIVPLDNFLRLIGHWYLGSPNSATWTRSTKPCGRWASNCFRKPLTGLRGATSMALCSRAPTVSRSSAPPRAQGFTSISRAAFMAATLCAPMRMPQPTRCWGTRIRYCSP